MSEPIRILVATMSGSAELVAEELADALERAGRKASIHRMEKVTPARLAAGGLFIVCSSTYGTGDVPDNGQALYTGLQAERPDLSGVRYGLICLGDMTYSATFCGGGKRFDAVLQELGATRIGEPMQHNRSSGTFPDEMALEWLDRWLPLTEN